MKAGSFDVETAKEVLGDAEVRRIGDLARAAADRGEKIEELPTALGSTYWERVVSALRHVVWNDAYDKRVARIERIKNR